MQATVHVFSFRGSGRRPFPKDSGHLGRRPSVNPTWSISPGSISLEDSESVCFDIFCCSCMDYSFRLLFAFVSMRRSRQAHFSFFGFFYGTCVHVHNTTTHSNKRSRLENADEKKIPTPQAPASPQGQVSLAG